MEGEERAHLAGLARRVELEDRRAAAAEAFDAALAGHAGTGRGGKGCKAAEDLGDGRLHGGCEGGVTRR